MKTFDDIFTKLTQQHMLEQNHPSLSANNASNAKLLSLNLWAICLFL